MCRLPESTPQFRDGKSDSGSRDIGPRYTDSSWVLLIVEDRCRRAGDGDGHGGVTLTGLPPAVVRLPVRARRLLVTGGRIRTGGLLAVGWDRPSGDLP